MKHIQRLSIVNFHKYVKIILIFLYLDFNNNFYQNQKVKTFQKPIQQIVLSQKPIYLIMFDILLQHAQEYLLKFFSVAFLELYSIYDKQNMMRNSSYQQFLTMPEENFQVLDKNAINSLTFTQSKPNGSYLFYDHHHQIRLQRFVVKIKPNNRRETLAIYEWRSGTGFPFVKTYYVETVRRTTNQQVFHVFNELCQVKLSQLVDIPFNQLLYVLQQSLIGFDRLFSKFGIFLISPSMISINEKGKCRVWINEQFQLNSCIPNNVSQAESIGKLLKIFSQKVSKSKLSTTFFQSLKYQQNVIDLLSIVQKFIKDNKIKVPTRFSLASFSTVKNVVKRFNSHANIYFPDDLQKHKSLKKQISSFKKISYINEESPTKPIAISTIKKMGTISALIGKSIDQQPEHFNPTGTLKLQIKPSCPNNVPSYILKNQKTSRKAQKSMNTLLKQSDKRTQIMKNSFEIDDIITPTNSDKKNKQVSYFEQNSFQFEDKIDQMRTTNKKLPYKDYEQEDEDEVPYTPADICKKNGWSVKMEDLKSTASLKKSYSIGGQKNSLNSKHQFKILKPPVYESIVSEDF